MVEPISLKWEEKVNDSISMLMIIPWEQKLRLQNVRTPVTYLLLLLKSQRSVAIWGKCSCLWYRETGPIRDLSSGTGKLCIFGNLGIVFIWICFVSCLLFLLLYVSLRNLCAGT